MQYLKKKNYFVEKSFVKKNFRCGDIICMKTAEFSDINSQIIFLYLLPKPTLEYNVV